MKLKIKKKYVFLVMRTQDLLSQQLSYIISNTDPHGSKFHILFLFLPLAISTPQVVAKKCSQKLKVIKEEKNVEFGSMRLCVWVLVLPLMNHGILRKPFYLCL